MLRRYNPRRPTRREQDYDSSNRRQNQEKRICWGERALIVRFLSQLSFLSFGPDKEIHNSFRNLAMLIKAYRETRVFGKALPWAVFAFQTFIDMHRELGSDTGRGFKEFRNSCAWMLKSMRSCYELGKTNYCNEWNEKNKKVFQNSIGTFSAFLVDDFFTVEIFPRVRRGSKQFRRLEPSMSAWSPHSYLKNNPIFCGI